MLHFLFHLATLSYFVYLRFGSYLALGKQLVSRINSFFYFIIYYTLLSCSDFSPINCIIYLLYWIQFSYSFIKFLKSLFWILNFEIPFHCFYITERVYPIGQIAHGYLANILTSQLSANPFFKGDSPLYWCLSPLNQFI